MIRLGVNVDHIATLRQVRGGKTAYPDLWEHVQICLKAGADQITIHLREDQRHIQTSDFLFLVKKIRSRLNLEMAVNDDILKLAKKWRPDWCCFVPEKRAELTTEGGLNVVASSQKIKKAIAELRLKKVKVSLFIDPSLQQVSESALVGAAAVEFHTGHWVEYSGKKKQQEWKRLLQAAELAHDLGLRVHAGHGLDEKHTRLIKKLPYLQEVNIGHFLVCKSLSIGMQKAVQKMKQILSVKNIGSKLN